MRRRDFIAGITGSAAAWPVAARAQQPIPTVGMLHSQTQASEAGRLLAILQGLQEAGFVVGQNVAIEHRFADGRNNRLPELAAELVRRKVNVIFANTTPPAYAAKAATSKMPIVFVTGVDPVEVGLVASMNRPGGNLTGVTFLSNKLVAKRLELLSAVTPAGAPIGMLAAQRNPNTETDVRDALSAAKLLNRTLHVEKVQAEGGVEAGLNALLERRIGALFIAPQADFRISMQQLVLLPARHSLPTSFSSSDYVTAGGLMSYGPDQMDSYREAGAYVGRVLKGEKPNELPVLVATKYDFMINLKTASALKIVIPPSMLAISTSVVE